MTLALLAVSVALAFFLEAVTGFGGTLVAVSLGGALLPVRELLPAILPLNLVVSTIIVGRNHTAVDVPLLFRRVLPAMLLGFPVGAVLFRWLGARSGALEGALGLVVLGVTGARLWAAHASIPTRPELTHEGPQAAGRMIAALGLAGVVHGAVGVGGPIVVMTLGRLGLDKHVFRATLSALWALLGVALLVSYGVAGVLDAASLHLTLLLAPAMVLGLVAGQLVHARLDPVRFRTAVDALLVAAGVVLVGRSLVSQ